MVDGMSLIKKESQSSVRINLMEIGSISKD